MFSGFFATVRQPITNTGKVCHMINAHYLYKIHNANIPFEIIFLAYGTSTYKLGKLLNKILQQ